MACVCENDEVRDALWALWFLHCFYVEVWA